MIGLVKIDELVKSRKNVSFRTALQQGRGQGAQIPKNERDFPHAALTKDLAQRHIRSFCKAVKIVLCIIPLLLTACDGAISVGGRTIGVQSGKFIFSDGFVQTNFPYPYERTWAAAEKAMLDLKAQDIMKMERIGRGEIKGLIKDETVTVAVKHIQREGTAVAVRVGLVGNNIAAQLILERVARNLQ